MNAVDVARHSARFLPLPILKSLSGHVIYLPFYHSLQHDKPLAHIEHLYQLRTVEEFENDLDYLLQHFKPVSLQDLHDHANGIRRIDYPAFHPTFDDGLSEVYTLAREPMLRKGVTATTFLNSDFVNNEALFFGYKASLLVTELNNQREMGSLPDDIGRSIGQHNLGHEALCQYILDIRHPERNLLDTLASELGMNFSEFLATEKPYLTSEQIHKMSSEGFTFGAHSIDHPHFDDITLEEQLRQATESINYLSEYDNDVQSFSFPYSDAKVGQEFFTTIYSRFPELLIFGTQGFKRDSNPRIFHRHWLEGDHAPTSSYVKFAYAKTLLNSVLGRSRLQRF